MGFVGILLLAVLSTAATYYWFARRSASNPEKSVFPTVAVLPFENLDPDKANAFFASGIQDTILTRLASIPDIRVISRTSADSFSSHPENLRRIAHALRATDILEGSVQRVGKQVLINVQLINAETDTHLWAATYTRTLNNVFNVEGNVAKQVATALLNRLRPDQIERLDKPPTRDPKAYVLFLKANYDAERVFDRVNAVDPGTLVKQAIDLYRQAIKRDPKFALAYARLSVLESKSVWFNIGNTPFHGPDAERNAKRARTLAPDLAETYEAAGFVAFYEKRNYPLALTRFKRAQQLRPNDAELMGAIAAVLARQGKWEASLKALREAEQSDPQNPHWLESSGGSLIALRRYSDAQQALARAVALEPNNYMAKIRGMAVLLLTGQINKLKTRLANLPDDVNPPGIGAVFEYRVAMIQRKPKQALAAIQNAPDWVTGTTTVGIVPRSLLQADAWALQDNRSRARQFYRQAEHQIRILMKVQGDNPDLWSDLGMVAAELGDDQQAVADGKRAVALLPVSRDALSGSFYLTALAQIYARARQPAAAAKVIDQLLSMPAGRALSVRLLELDPVWDPIRNAPQFQAVLENHEAARAIKTAG